MSSQPIKQKQLGLKESSFPKFHGNDGFEGGAKNPKPLADYSDWEGTVKGKTKHTYKGD